jgi:hypothetical protein
LTALSGAGASTSSRATARRGTRAASPTAPRATQVVDRWHLLRSRREVAEHVVARHPSRLTEEEPSARPATPPLSQGRAPDYPVTTSTSLART